MKRFKKNQQGFVLFAALMILIIVVFLAVSVSFVSSTNSVSVSNSMLQKQAFQAALSGTDSLLAIINKDETKFATLAAATCDKPFDGQFKATNTIPINEQVDTRKVQVSWYACTATKNGVAVEPKDCLPDYECLAVIVSGVACPQGVAINSGQCTVVRHLQGIFNIE